MPRQIALPIILSHLPPAKRVALEGVLEIIKAMPNIGAVILGGSLAASNPSFDGDIDLWILTSDPISCVGALRDGSTDLVGFSYFLDNGHVPWFGRLITLFFNSGCDIGIDAGFVTNGDVDNVNTGPGSIVLWAEKRAQAFVERATQKRSFRRTPDERARKVLSNIVKLKKAVDRGEKWGALEYISRARREVLGMIRDSSDSGAHWYERPDRKVEALLGDEDNDALLNTVCKPAKSDLVKVGSLLISLSLKYGGVELHPDTVKVLTQVRQSLTGCNSLTTYTIGFVGAGRMGSPIIRHLIEHGFDVLVVENNDERAHAVEKIGAQVSTLDEVWASAKVLFFALPDVESTERVITGMLRKDGRRRVIVDLSTNSPVACRSLAEKCVSFGHGFLDAPMSGGVWGATDGTLTLMVGGCVSDVEFLRPVFSAFSTNVVHLGDTGSGCIAKLIHNMVGEIEVQAFAEAFCVGKLMEIPLNGLYSCLAGGMASSRVLTDLYANGRLKGELVNVPINIAEKDQRLLLDYAQRLGIDLCWTNVVYSRLAKLQRDGLGNKDVTATLTWFEKHHRVEVGTPLNE